MLRPTHPAERSRSWAGLALVLVAAGLAHFVIPRFYVRIVPRLLLGLPPSPELLVQVSGLAEVAAGVLVALPRTRRFGAWCAMGIFVAVWPANVQHAADNFPPADAEGWLTLARLPVQVPLILWAAKVARSSPP